ncbi:MAG: tetratricopeptide repeat protein [Treponema sp.]|jgi:tetratricopeptide (TPR) repeat protein|nr:tetratricopeptide repeat protein [Treponema sp.]
MEKNCPAKYCGAVVLWFAAAVFGFGQTNFTKGEALFMQNKPEEAAPYLENSIADDPAHVMACLYLGMVYEQLERNDEAIAAYRKILDRAGDLSANVANNLGNAYFKKGDAAGAERFYTQALDADPDYASARLGRANARLKAGSMRAALGDYELYLSLEPRSPKRPQIERLIALIHSESAAEERRKLLAEETARVREEAAKAEAERRQRLLDEVSASLQSAANSSQGLSSGAEDVEEYKSEFELE